MSGFAAVWHRDGRPADPADLDRAAATLRHRGGDGSGRWIDGDLGLIHELRCVTPESKRERQPVVAAEGRIRLVADARLDNRDELARRFDVRAGARASMTDADWILIAYLELGEGCLEILLGDFAFAIFDERDRRLFCARDVMGVRPLVYHLSDDLIAVASEVEALLALPGVPHRIDEGRLRGWVEGDFDDREATLYEGIRRLPAAHGLSVHPNRDRRWRYWSIADAPDVRLGSDDEYSEAFLEVFRTSVTCRVRSDHPVGSLLSGGLDSSSITAVANRARTASSRSPIRTFSGIFPSLPAADLRAIDERRYIEAVRSWLPVDGHDFEADRSGPFQHLERGVATMGGPIVPYNLYLHDGLFRAAQAQGVRVILDGIDGDSAVSHGFGRFDDLALEGDWDTLGHELERLVERSDVSARVVLNTTGLRALRGTAAAGRPWSWWRGVRELHRRFGVRRRHMLVHHGLRPALRLGAERPRLERHRTGHEESIRMPVFQLSMECMDRAANRLGLEPAYPFFDRRLLEFSVGIPADQKLSDGWTRMVLRRAMEGLLPPVVQWRHGKQSLFPNFRRDLRSRGAEYVTEATRGQPDWLVEAAARHSSVFFAKGGDRGQTAALGVFRALTASVWLQERARRPFRDEPARVNYQSSGRSRERSSQRNPPMMRTRE